MKIKLLHIVIASLVILCSCKNNPTFKPQNNPSDTSKVAVVPTGQGPVASKAAITFRSYCNQRFGYCVDYPKDILYPQGESENGDGQTFKSKDAENTMLVYRDFRDRVDPEATYNIEQAFEEDSRGNDPEHPKKVITYKKMGKDSYTVSGYNNGKIFYQKTLVSNGELITCLLEYKESDRKLFDPIVERMVKSFK